MTHHKPSRAEPNRAEATLDRHCRPCDRVETVGFGSESGATCSIRSD
jgi:hypothetical protein